MQYEQLKLENQLCFPVYAASRLIIRKYQPYLDTLGLTYPQYLVLMVLWETDSISVNEISKKLILNTNTVTPLLKRMETMGILKKKKAKSDERMVIVTLTKKGIALQTKASFIPEMLAENILSGPFKLDELLQLKQQLHNLINYLVDNNPTETPIICKS